MPLTQPQVVIQDEAGTVAAVTSITYAGSGVKVGVAGTAGTVTVQGNLASKNIGFWNSIGSSTGVLTSWGLVAPTAVGTVTSRVVATTNIFTQAKRTGYVSVSTAGGLCGIRAGVSQFWRGNGAFLGGFRFVCRFGVSDAATVSGARMFVGLSAATGAATNVEPTTVATYPNVIGVGQISTSNNMQLITTSATTNSVTDLGASFPANTLSADFYELQMYCAQNSSQVVVTLTNLKTGLVSTTTVTVNLPANTALLGPQIWRCNNATALAVAIDVASLYIDTDI